MCLALFYRHYKGHYYQVLGEALDTQDDSIVIVYRTLYSSAYSLFTRPKEIFFGKIHLPDGMEKARFEAVAYDDLPAEARARVLPALPLWKDGEKGGPPCAEAAAGTEEEGAALGSVSKKP